MLVGGEPITRGLLGVSREGIDVKDKAWEGKGDCVGVLVGSAGLCVLSSAATRCPAAGAILLCFRCKPETTALCEGELY